MLRLFLFVLLTCAFISSAEVIVLGNANFTSAIQEHPFILVMFYAPWCSFSKQFLPEYEKIEEDLRDVGIPLAKVNCVEEKDLYWQHNIEGFPTLKLFIRGDPILYRGEREYDHVVGWLQKLSSKTVVDIDANYGLEEFKKGSLTPTTAISVLYVDGTDKNSGLVDLYDLACKKVEIVPCALSTSTATAAATGVASLPSLVVYRSFTNEPETKLSDASLFNSSTGIMEFIQLSAFPSLVELTKDTDSLLFSDKRIGYNIHVLVALDKSLPSNQELISALRTQAGEYSGRCAFAYIDTGRPTPYTTTILNDLGITHDKAPVAMIIRSAKTEVQFYQIADGTDVNAESMSYFVRDFFSGTLKPVRTAIQQD